MTRREELREQIHNIVSAYGMTHGGYGQKSCNAAVDSILAVRDYNEFGRGYQACYDELVTGGQSPRPPFTWDDVRLLRYETPGSDPACDGSAKRRLRFLALADRIAALLPPRTP